MCATGNLLAGARACCVQVRSEFEPKFGTKAKTAAPHAFDWQFASFLKRNIEYCNKNPDEVSKIQKVKAKVDEVQGILVQDIDKARLMAECILKFAQWFWLFCEKGCVYIPTP